MILCMQIEGFIPFMSAIVHPNTAWSHSTLRNFSSSALVREEKIMTHGIELSPKNAYLKWDQSSLSSSLGGFFMKGTGVDGKYCSSINFSSFENAVVAYKYSTHSLVAWSSAVFVTEGVMHASNGNVGCPSWNISLVSLSIASMWKQSSLSIGYS